MGPAEIEADYPIARTRQQVLTSLDDASCLRRLPCFVVTAAGYRSTGHAACAGHATTRLAFGNSIRPLVSSLSAALVFSTAVPRCRPSRPALGRVLLKR